MLRAVLAILVIAAIVAVSQPVIQGGRQDHAATLLAGEVDGLTDAARDLVRTDEAVAGPGARRIVTVELPKPGRFSAGANAVEIDGGQPSTIEWVVDGGTTHRRVLEDVRFRTAEDESLRLEGTGEQRVVLSLTGSAGDPTVRIERFEPPDGDDDA